MCSGEDSDLAKTGRKVLVNKRSIVRQDCATCPSGGVPSLLVRREAGGRGGKEGGREGGKEGRKVGEGLKA